MKVLKSSEYSQFVFTLENRPLQTSNIKFKNLVASMKANGFLPSFPISVRRSGSRYQILDGQNRFEAAKQLGIPILYVVYEADTQLDIAALNDTQRAWSMKDFVGSYATQGKADFHFLQEFAKRGKLHLNRAASLLGGEMYASGNVRKKLRDGTFEIRDVEYAERVVALVNAVAEHCHEPWVRGTPCIAALSRLLRVSEFDPALLIKRIPANMSLFINQPTVDAFTEMFERIYNSRSRAAVPLRFLADQAMKHRCGAGRRFEKRSA